MTHEGCLETTDEARSAQLRKGLVCGFAIAVSITGAQLVSQDLASGAQHWVELLETFAANAAASLPWLPAGFLIARFTRQRPLSNLQNGSWHALASIGLGCAFLLWLATFHTLIVHRLEGSFLDHLRFWVLEDLRQFGSITLLVYWVLAWATHAVQASQIAQDDCTAATQFQPWVVRTRNKQVLVDPRNIEWIQAEGDYARLHLDGSSVLVRRSLTDLENELIPFGFARIHRSTLVRLDYVKEVRSESHGDATLVLRNAVRLRVSRRRRKGLAPLGL